MLVYYELDMVRREAGTVLVPYLPARLHPAIGELVGRLTSETGQGIGRLEQVSLERQLAERDAAAIKAQFARDADLLRLLSGELTHLGAMAGGTEKKSYETLNVQMSGPGGVLARWSVAPANGGDSGRLVLVASGGRGVLTMPEGGEGWKMEFETGGQRADRQLAGLERTAGGTRSIAGGDRRRERRGPTGSMRRGASSWPKRSTAAWPAAGRSNCITRNTTKPAPSKA